MCLLEGLGTRHAAIGALSTVKAHNPKELAMRALEHSDVLHAESSRHTRHTQASRTRRSISGINAGGLVDKAAHVQKIRCLVCTSGLLLP